MNAEETARLTTEMRSESEMSDIADINARNEDDSEPLLAAAKEGNLDKVKELIKSGSDPYVTDSHGKNFLYYAIQNGHFDIVKYAVDEEKFNIKASDTKRMGCPHKCIILYWAVCDAIAYDQLDIVKYFVGTLKSSICSPLNTAAHHGHLDIVKYLVEEKKVKIDGTKFSIQSPLCNASIEGKLDVVKYLVKKGSNVNRKCMLLTPPLHFAIRGNHLDVVKFLAENGADVRKTDVGGNSPLHYALIFEVYDAVRYLLEERNVNINATNNDKNTPLHIAAEHGSLEIVKYLVERGANLGARNTEGKIPFDIATYYAKTDIADYLQQKENRFRRGIATNFYTEGSKNYYNFQHYKPLNSMINNVIGYDKKSANSKGDAFPGNSNFKPMQNVDVIGTLLLLDALIRVFTNQKYVNMSDSAFSEPASLANALKVTEKFEDLLKMFSEIPAAERIDLTEVYSNVYKAFKSGNNSEVYPILCSYAKSFHSLKPEEFEQLLKVYMSNDYSVILSKAALLKDETHENLSHLLSQSCFSPEGNLHI